MLASTFINPLRILKHSISFPWSRCFLRENKFSRARLSSYGLLCKDVIIFVALRWTASSFAISLSLAWRGAKICTAYTRCGLTNQADIQLFNYAFIFKREISAYETAPSSSFTCSIFALLGEFEGRRNCNVKVCDALYAFKFSTIHLVFNFSFYFLCLPVKCGIC